MKDVYIDFEKFKLGLYALDDTTKAPFGSARIMTNMMVTDRGGIAPRPGTTILGTSNSSTHSIRGFYNFRRSFDQNELLIKTYDTYFEVYSKNNTTADWFKVKTGFTSDSEFGFITSLVNTDNNDYVIFCNRYQDYSRWSGAVTQLNGALVGAETAITVDSVLLSDIFESKTASASSATTLDISPAAWAASQWVNLYVYITSGVHSGKIRKITANTTTQITFDTLGSDPGLCTFEIRKPAFPATGTLIYNGTTIAYTGIPTATTFTVGSAHAASDRSGITLVPDVYPANPRGNRLTNYLGRVIVGNVRSALARDSGGALQGYSSAGSYFVSKINNPFDFTFTATRVAGEGDIIATPYGGGDITDVAHHENAAYIFKPRYIESVQYSQDANDLANREPLKAEIGNIGRVIKGSDDLYFITADNKFVSLGRVLQKDSTEQSINIGFKIKRLLDTYTIDTGKGIEHKDKLYIPAKSSSTVTNNDILIVYNKINQAFDGIWNIGANGLEGFNNLLYYAESTGANVYQMLTGHSDVNGTDRFPIASAYATHFLNLAASKGYFQALNSIYFEGYIRGASEITFKSWKDFAIDPFLQFTFSGSESGFITSSNFSAALGIGALGTEPLGSISQPDSEGRSHFYFRVYFPFQYGNFFSVGWNSQGTDLDYEISRFGLGLRESVSVDTTKVKTI